MKSRYIFYLIIISLAIQIELSYAERFDASNGAGTHYLMYEYFITPAEAETACAQFAVQHGYDPFSVCNLSWTFEPTEHHPASLP